MDRFCEELPTRQPRLVERCTKTVRSGVEKAEGKTEVSSQTEEQERCETDTSQPQSMYLSKKNLESDDKKIERVLWYPEITLFDTQETDSYVFVFQTPTNKVTQTDLGEPEPAKDRRLTYLTKSLKFLVRLWVFLH